MYKRVPYKSLHPQEDKLINGAYNYVLLISPNGQITMDINGIIFDSSIQLMWIA